MINLAWEMESSVDQSSLPVLLGVLSNETFPVFNKPAFEVYDENKDVLFKTSELIDTFRDDDENLEPAVYDLFFNVDCNSPYFDEANGVNNTREVCVEITGNKNKTGIIQYSSFVVAELEARVEQFLALDRTNPVTVGAMSLETAIEFGSYTFPLKLFIKELVNIMSDGFSEYLEGQRDRVTEWIIGSSIAFIILSMIGIPIIVRHIRLVENDLKNML
mmetsp:Transcript_22365/g.19274  ORF Transcript_22365/g.19274 Transcript_22365/m.19274 type:complete len:218 (-) Transcript_22365:294-947(-)|eukprot:CAMPEP_0114578050 /NCGR_PEP_ID=MMETSP0125-20121206/2629_1 /TAXON_ID=485358 ORGANISM="Aristerostoma sp., Strain ATCC 50986" /NCGR_SAMPLE_ID=MMETSP0125 /ASSEMBLY_ACC=CAM_ASM_000245 /LENGTH=217 /DNA_ID=CAMNT_0001767811 /DNA_START=4954 /DNA_END=5607 /DNA_ORIENTATION=-